MIWVDMRALMAEPSWENEQLLDEVLWNECEVNSSAGSRLRAATPGWFRFCFSGPEGGEDGLAAVEEFGRRLQSAQERGLFPVGKRAAVGTTASAGDA